MRKRRLLLLALTAAAGLLTACTATRYVEVPQVHERIVSRTDSIVRTDSIYVSDSTATARQGDTLVVERWHTRTREIVRERTFRDTVCLRDTVTLVYQQPVPNPDSRQKGGLAWWQWLVTLCCVAVTGTFCLKVFYRRAP